MLKIKYGNYLALILVAFFFVGGTGFAPVSAGASCNLTKIQIAAGTMTATSEKVSITATPSCWSGKVEVNRGNVDFRLITVTVANGQGIGSIVRISVAQNVHPYALNPGMRGNNVIVPALA